MLLVQLILIILLLGVMLLVRPLQLLLVVC